MKSVVSISLLTIAATVGGAQQPPVRPIPMPVPALAPVPRPFAGNWDIAPIPPLPPLDFLTDLDLSLNFDLGSRSNDLQLRSQELADRALAQADRAMQNVDLRNLQNLVDAASWNVASSDERFARSPRAPWVRGDPADSLYRLAREAFNQGDWRHAADLFGQIPQKYPRSAYVSDCAYYEAFARYRIGTTDDLHQALSLLANQTGPAARGSMNADAAALAARIRGALAARGDQQAAAEIAKEAQKSGGCDREEMSVKAEALNALGQMDPGEATPLLRRVLARKDTCSRQLKRSAMFILVRRGDTVATNTLISIATNDSEDVDLRSDAISYLGRMAGDQSLATLQTLLRSSNDDRIQAAAVRALANNDSPAARQGVRALIERNDVSESLRSEAIASLASDQSSADDGAFLRGVYPKLPSERLKRSVLLALARIGGPDNQRFIMAVARDPNESSDVRGAAISYAGRLTDVTVDDLSKLYDASDSRNMREQIIGVLAQRSEPTAADKLMDIVKNGTDPNTRRVAINALSRKKDDPRVTKFLLDLVGR
jgi:HEAT repeat protein